MTNQSAKEPGGYITISAYRPKPKWVFIKRLMFRLHLRTTYPIKLQGGKQSYWGSIIRTDIVSADIRPLMRRNHDS